MAMFKPAHPGEILREEIIEALGLSVTAAAKHLGVGRQTLSNLVNEKSGVSPEMAIRLEKAFGVKADVWLGMQTAYDLAEARRMERKIKVERYEDRAPHAA